MAERKAISVYYFENNIHHVFDQTEDNKQLVYLIRTYSGKQWMMTVYEHDSTVDTYTLLATYVGINLADPFSDKYRMVWMPELVTH